MGSQARLEKASVSTKDQLSTFAETPAEPQPAVRGASAVRLLKAA